MEHVADEAQAFGELKRVMKPDGRMIFSVPVTMETETIEIEGICSDEDREKYYGQKDHVRLYGRDYKERIESYGWEVQQYTPECMVSMSEIEKFGYIKMIFYLFVQKPAQK